MSTTTPHEDQVRQLNVGEEVDISSAKRVGEFRLQLRFSDGVEREIDFERFLRGASNPQIREFLDERKFASFELKDGELVWGDFELCFPISDLYDGNI
jgi:hypothetical protein